SSVDCSGWPAAGAAGTRPWIRAASTMMDARPGNISEAHLESAEDAAAEGASAQRVAGLDVTVLDQVAAGHRQLQLVGQPPAQPHVGLDIAVDRGQVVDGAQPHVQ